MGKLSGYLLYSHAIERECTEVFEGLILIEEEEKDLILEACDETE